MKLDRTSRRVLGSLVEKRLTTPDQYPLTLNALVLACNQSNNRDPVVKFEDFEVDGCLRQLMIEGLVTRMERDGGRTDRWKERLTESLHLADADMAVLAELLLRGPQTEQELSKRAARMAPVGSPEEVAARLARFAEPAAGRLVEHLPRRSGERIARWRHLLGGADEPLPVPSEDTTAALTQSGERRIRDIAEAVAGEARSPSEATTRIMGASAEAALLRAQIDRMQGELDALRARVARLEGGPS
ncbi:MAG: hypothetical protein HMLKMBBP_02535 [Planctomycetes bacterium]|nr:hypothetical protein [Planctomycetota bacterium]